MSHSFIFRQLLPLVLWALCTTVVFPAEEFAEFKLLADIETRPVTDGAPIRTIGFSGGEVFTDLETYRTTRTFLRKPGTEAPVPLFDGIPKQYHALPGLLLMNNGERLFGLVGGESAVSDLGEFSFFSFIGTIGGIHYFVGAVEHGAYRSGQLWRTDGTKAGTSAVSDLEVSWDQPWFILGGRIFGTGITPSTGWEPVISDGTPEGTRVLMDIHPGSTSSGATFLAEFQGKLLFVATDLVAGTEYWMTDGTPEGTYLLGDLHQGPSYTRYLGKVAGRLLLTAGEFSLFASDGTLSGTRRLLDERIIRTLYVNEEEGWGLLGGDELYRTDGTPEGTHLLKDIESDPWEARTSQPEYFGKAGQQVLLTATTAADGKEIWTTDGTEEGTTKLIDLAPGSGSPLLVAPENSPDTSSFIFMATDPSGNAGVWNTDGTPAGTHLVATFHSALDLNSRIEPLAGRWIGDKLFLVTRQAEPSGWSVGLWSFDPQAPSLSLLKSFFTLPDTGRISPLQEVEGKLRMGIDDTFTGPGWWTSDGTAAGTRVLESPYSPSSNESSNPAFLGNLGSEVLFQATERGRKTLWITDGGTPRRLGHLTAQRVTEWNGKGYFFATTGTESRLWTTDGTPAGTIPVLPRVISSSYPITPVPFAGGFVFSGYTAESGIRIWFSDGTEEGTRMLSGAMIDGLPLVARLDNAMIYRDKLIFRGDYTFFPPDEPGYGQHLYSWDGTEFVSLRKSDYTDTLLGVTEEGCFFAASSASSGRELHITDGTVQGTRLVKDLNPQGNSEGILTTATTATVHSGRFHFLGYDGASMRIYVSDGTEAGTQPILQGNGHCQSLTGWGNEIFFLQSGDLRAVPVTGGISRLVAAGDFQKITKRADALYLQADGGSIWKFDGDLHPLGGLVSLPFYSYDGRVYGSSSRFGNIGMEPVVLIAKPPVLLEAQESWIPAVSGEEVVVSAGVTKGFFDYQWFKGRPGDTTQPIGGSSSSMVVPTGNTASSYWVRVSGDPLNGSISTLETPARTVQPVTRLEYQARRHFPPLLPGGNSPMDLAADGDGDGMNDLLELVLGADPRKPDAPPHPPQAKVAQSSAGDGPVEISFRKLAEPHSGYSWELEASPSLTPDTWQLVDPDHIAIRPEGTDRMMETVTLTIPFSRAEGRRFFRLKVRVTPAE